MKKSDYVYFIHSREYFDRKNEVLNKIGKEFKMGTVVVNNTRKEFTTITLNPNFLKSRYIDATIVAEGILSGFIYEDTRTTTKGGL